MAVSSKQENRVIKLGYSSDNLRYIAWLKGQELIMLIIVHYALKYCLYEEQIFKLKNDKIYLDKGVFIKKIEMPLLFFNN